MIFNYAPLLSKWSLGFFLCVIYLGNNIAWSFVDSIICPVPRQRACGSSLWSSKLGEFSSCNGRICGFSSGNESSYYHETVHGADMLGWFSCLPKVLPSASGTGEERIILFGGYDKSRQELTDRLFSINPKGSFLISLISNSIADSSPLY